jgi:hypothetical protein
LVRSGVTELARFGTTVNGIRPGFIETPDDSCHAVGGARAAHRKPVGSRRSTGRYCRRGGFPVFRGCLFHYRAHSGCQRRRIDVVHELGSGAADRHRFQATDAIGKSVATTVKPGENSQAGRSSAFPSPFVGLRGVPTGVSAVDVEVRHQGDGSFAHMLFDRDSCLVGITGGDGVDQDLVAGHGHI